MQKAPDTKVPFRGGNRLLLRGLSADTSTWTTSAWVWLDVERDLTGGIVLRAGDTGGQRGGLQAAPRTQPVARPGQSSSAAGLTKCSVERHQTLLGVEQMS